MGDSWYTAFRSYLQQTSICSEELVGDRAAIEPGLRELGLPAPVICDADRDIIV